MDSADVVVCGAGIAGVATAYFLTVELGVEKVVLCDPRPPLTLTSDKSTECYRNWWPNPSMVGLMDRSIDLLEGLAGSSGNAIHLNRRGYLYVTADRGRVDSWETAGRRIAAAGAGELRTHDGVGQVQTYQAERDDLDGADLITDPKLIKAYFPYVTDRAVALLHARRAGWFSAQQLGAIMLERAKEAGLVHLARAVTGIDGQSGKVRAVTLDDGETIDAPAVVNAAGPLIGSVAALTGETLPVYSELHLKVTFKEHRRVIPPQAPMLIWSDPQHIDWSPEVARILEADPDQRFLLDELPVGCHGRPEGGAESPYVLALWEYRRRIMEPTWPVPVDPLYAEVVMRGMSAMVPGLSAYRDRLPRSTIDGGYYTKTDENLPLIGPTATPGMFVVGALSGFGVMVAAGAGELAAQHITGGRLPDYAAAFLPSRYDDPNYIATPAGDDDGQL
jgi:glycine/D-amino acid oxidase-like deaminating enzyme